MQIPHDDDLNGSDQLTYMAWVNPRSWSGIRQVMAKSVHGGGSGRAQMGIFSENGSLTGRAETAAGRINVTTSLPSTNSWTHVALVFSGTGLTLYINGSAANTNAFAATTLNPTTDPLNISKRVGSNQYFFDGLIDEVRVYRTALGSQEITSILNERLPCAASPLDHYAIAHGGQAVTCQAEPITISAHLSDHTVDTSATNMITLATSTNNGDWSLVNGSGMLTNSGNGAGTYSFVAADNGTVQLALQNTVAETLNIQVTDGTVSETSGSAQASEDPDLIFNDSGFRFLADGLGGNIGTQIAGKASNIMPGNQVLELEAIRTNNMTGACEAALQGNIAVELGFECINPTACSANQVSIDGTDIAANNNGSVTNYTPINLDFGDDMDTTAPFVLNYPDAGQIRLHARYQIPSGGDQLAGSSNNFVVVPAGLCVEATETNNACTPANASCTAFKKADEVFDLTIRAVAWESAGETDAAFCTGNATTPNFELGSITLTHSLVAPSGGMPGSIGVMSAAIGSTDDAGVTVNQTVSEVGVFTMRAEPPAYQGETIAASSSANIGRFYPDRFELTGGMLTEACATVTPFTYMEQDFAVSYQLTAVNTGGNTTENYQGAFAKLNQSQLDYLALSMGPLGNVNRTSRLVDGTTLNWVDGVAGLTNEAMRF